MYLCLSPHPDDVPLSIGGLVAGLTDAPVVMLTLMAGDPPQPPPDTPLTRDLHQRWDLGDSPSARRRNEDHAAARVLGIAQVIHADLPDCPYRRHEGQPLYPDEDSLWGAVHPQDPARAALDALPLPPTVTHLLAPLGVGGHVDHQLTRDWALRLARSRPELTLWLYADYPYSAAPGAVEAALNALPDALRARLKPQRAVLHEVQVRAKLEAVAHYRSQISTFWRDAAEMEAKLRAQMQHDGQPTEVYWVLLPGPPSPPSPVHEAAN